MNSPIRTLYLFDQIWSGNGGTEQHLWWLLSRLPNSQIVKHLIVFSKVIAVDPALIPVPPTILGDKYGRGFFSFVKKFFFLVSYIRKHQIDLIHAFTIWDELIAVFACLFAGRGKTLGHRRDVGYARNKKQQWISRIVQFFKIPYIANSEAAKQAAYEKERISLKRFEVIRNPIVPERIQDGSQNVFLRENLPVLADTFIVGMVATLRPIKGHEVLLRAAKIVLEAYPEAYFLFVGVQQKQCLADLKKLAGELGVADRIIWFGGLDNPYRILPHFTVAVLSSHSESFSNAVLEYSVAGIPAVVTDVGGLREIIQDGETGFVVPPNNPEALAEKICELLGDSKKREQFGKRGQEFVNSQYSEATILEQYLNFYRHVAENK